MTTPLSGKYGKEKTGKCIDKTCAEKSFVSNQIVHSITYLVVEDMIERLPICQQIGNLSCKSSIYLFTINHSV